MIKKLGLFFIACFIGVTEAHSQNFIKNFNSVSAFVQFGNGMLFAGDDGIHGPELWKTDGTVAGTVMVKDIYTGTNGSGITSIGIFKGNAYFAANDGIHGTQLWRSDGTVNGTMMVKNVGPTPTGYGFQPKLFTTYNGLLYFVGTSDGITFSLWKTDGTSNGTVQVTVNDYSIISQLVVAGNKLYFSKNGLWASDGTAAGTKQIPVDNNQILGMLTNINNNLVFITDENYYFQNVNLYALSPSSSKPVLLQSFNPGGYSTSTIDNITAVGSNFFFSIRTSGIGSSGTDVLWTSDCTPAGTKIVGSYDWPQGLAYNNMRNFVNFNNKLYFAATSNAKLYTSDGTAAGTVQAANAMVDYNITPVVSNGKLFFSSQGALWSYNGTTASQAINQPTQPQGLFDGNGHLYFTINSNYPVGLWNNEPAGQLQVSMKQQKLVNGATSAIASKPDSVVTNQVNLTNTGNNALVFSEISVSGASFYVNGTPPQTLPPGGQTSFNLLYSPLKAEQVGALLTIKSNDNSGETDFIYNLNGTASGTVMKTPVVPSGGLNKEIVFADSNAAFTLSNNVISEKLPVNTSIGAFGVTNGSGYQYQLVAGNGSADNGSFTIVNGTLQSASIFNFAIRNTYSIRVQATMGTSTIQKIFAIKVSNQQANLAEACAKSFQNLTYSLNDATYAGTRIVAVGTGGVILKSDDAGQTWKKVNSGITNDFYRVQFTSSKTGYISGQSPPMLKTEDGGNTWFPLTWPPSPQYASGFTNMYFASDSVGYVVTNSNAYNPSSIFKTTDGGHSWNQLSYTNYESNFYGVWFTDKNTGFICGSSGTLVRTTDGGNTWQAISVSAVGSSTAFSNITFVSAKVGYMTSNSGDVLQTTDGGNTWARSGVLQSDGIVDRIYFRDSNNGYALAGFNSAYLYVTADGGHTWTMQTVGQAGVFTALAFDNKGTNLCLVGHADGLGATAQQGSVIYTGSGKGTWVQQSYIGNSTYVAGNLFANGTGYVFGSTSLKTTDGGTTWKPMNISIPYGDYLTTGVFLNADTGFYADDYNLYKSTDGGNTWVLKNKDTTTPVAVPVTFYNSNLGFYANGQTLYRTNDGGDTWSPVLKPLGLGLRNISIADRLTVYTTGIGMPLYKSTDGGNTWKSTNFQDDQIILSLHFFDALTGLAGGVKGLLLRTTDGGQTWTQLTTSMQLDIMNMQFVDNMHGYAYTAYDEGQGGTQIYETIDGGLNWSQILQPGNGYGFPSFQINDGQLFIAGYSGWLMKLNNTSLPPVNAGYIAGDTVVVSGIKTAYTVAAVPNTYYKWNISGAQFVEYHNNQVIVSWKNGGKYTLQVTPYNNCSNGQSRIIAVDVEDMPAPEISGPDTVANYAANVIYSTPVSTNSFSWTATNNVSIKSSSNQATVNWGKPGNGLVTVVETSKALNMQKSSVLNVVIQQGKVALPDSNFMVSVTSASCRGSANGSIGIKAQDVLNYTVTVTGPGGFTKNLSFTDNLTINSLDTGVYNICIGISGNSTFQRCYSVNVTEPKLLSAYSVVNQTSRTVTIDLAGANTYYINLNGKTYQTNASQVNLPLNNGANQLQIQTDKACQGVIQKVINMDVITVYPVPFIDVLNIDLGGSKVSTAGITISDSFGKIVYNKQAANNNGKLQVYVPNFMIGTYVLRVTLGSTSVIFKVLKQ
ncbi:YCF48-related protein [Mucilaginibacter sp. NFR10]|uniref:YCF48-related protein n=1 Tax=Mucilaginibacter sp. NFR10 TaxID=1566292 RepID=UPI0008712BA9|nr:YCF48-related protein [Mucilaginibacter sp. NFR10]SCW50072.1 ELWxxDGT repeat-containing protein [Mucilaginibacter sp. NFR10]